MRGVGRTSLVVGALAGLAAFASPSLAVPTFGNNDLKGEYVFIVTEVHRVMLPGAPAPVVEHCVISGTVNFDGVSTMSVDAVQRCSVTGTGSVVGAQYYVVDADGSFLISESPGMADPVHGQIADHGRSLLLDGTRRTNPEILNWSGIAMRR